MRGVPRPKEVGHSYSRTDRAIVHIDVPIPAEGLAGEIAIRIADLSKVRARPTDLDGVQALPDASPRSVRNVAKQLRHSEMPQAGAIWPPGEGRARGHRGLQAPGQQARHDLRWVGESGTRSETATPQLRERAPTFGELYAYPQCTELCASPYRLVPVAQSLNQYAERR